MDEPKISYRYLSRTETEALVIKFIATNRLDAIWTKDDEGYISLNISVKEDDK